MAASADRVGSAEVSSARVQLDLISGKDQLPGHRDGEVTVLDLHQVHVAEVPLVPEEGQVVLVPAGPLDLPGVAEQRTGLPEQVECDVAQRDVLFDLRGAGDPLRQSLGQDQRVITQSEHVGNKGGAIDITGRAAGTHRWDTPAGTS